MARGWSGGRTGLHDETGQRVTFVEPRVRTRMSRFAREMWEEHGHEAWSMEHGARIPWDVRGWDHEKGKIWGDDGG